MESEREICKLEVAHLTVFFFQGIQNKYPSVTQKVIAGSCSFVWLEK